MFGCDCIWICVSGHNDITKKVSKYRGENRGLIPGVLHIKKKEPSKEIGSNQ